MLNMSAIVFFLLLIASLFWGYLVAVIWVYSHFPILIKVLFTVCFLECLLVIWVAH